MLGFKRFETAAVTIRGIELAEKIKKHQFNLKPLTGKATTAPEIWAAVLAARNLQSLSPDKNIHLRKFAPEPSAEAFQHWHPKFRFPVLRGAFAA